MSKKPETPKETWFARFFEKWGEQVVEDGPVKTGWEAGEGKLVQNSLEAVRRMNEEKRNDTNQKKSGCFLTSACVEAAGLADDCRELTMLRHFRDSYVSNLTGGKALIAEYYDIAPLIVMTIKRSPTAKQIFAEVFLSLQKIVGLIEKRSFDQAVESYQSLVAQLKNKYLDI